MLGPAADLRLDPDLRELPLDDRDDLVDVRLALEAPLGHLALQVHVGVRVQRPEREAPAPDAIAAAFEMQRMLLDEVEKLDEPHRSTIARFYFHGETAAAIARQDRVGETPVPVW